MWVPNIHRNSIATAILLLFTIFRSVAQTVVSGQVIDGADKEDISYTTVAVVTTSDGKQVAEVLSDENGQFSFAGLPPGEYIIKYLYAGYQERLIPLVVDAQSQFHDLGKINLEQQAGFHGSVGINFGLGTLTRRRADLPTPLGSYHLNPKFMPSVNLNYNTKKIRYFLQTELIRQQTVPDNEFTNLNVGDASFESQVPDNRVLTRYAVRGGLSWILDAKNVFTFLGIFDYESHTDTAQVAYLDADNKQVLRYWSWYERERLGLAGTSVSYKHKFTGEGHELNAMLQYTRGWDDELFRLHELSDVYTGSDTANFVAKDHIIQFSTGYVMPLQSGRIEAGAKGHIRRLPATYTVQISDLSMMYPGMGNRSEWSEDLAALYAKWLLESKRFGVEASLQAEYTNVYNDISQDNYYYPTNDAYDYFDILPDIKLTWKIDKRNRLSAFYNRSIDRPGELLLRFYPIYHDPGLIRTGNPYLRPQYTGYSGLAYQYNWESGSVSISGYYKSIKAPFSRIFSLDGETGRRGILFRIFANTGKSNDTGVKATIGQQISRYWKVSGNFNWYRNKIAAYSGIIYFPYEHDFAIVASSNNTWDAKLDNHITIDKNTRLQLTGVYFAPRNIPQGRRHGLGGVNFAFKQPLGQGRVELAIIASDIFNTMGLKEDIYNDDFHAVYENYYETQTVSLGMKYRF